MANVEELTAPRLDRTSALAQALKRRRADFNLRFVQARHAKPTLDANIFKSVLLDTVAPIVQTLSHLPSDKLDTIIDGLYDVALELTGTGFLGNDSGSTTIDSAWSSILPAAKHLMALDCGGIVAAVSNAAYNLSRVPEANLQLWISDMSRLAPYCSDIAMFREAGKVVAWRCGMTHYRESALDSCARLSWELAAPCLGLSHPSGIPLAEFCARLKQDPWLYPSALAGGRFENVLKVTRQIGAFRGFGGQFLRPPDVVFSRGNFFATDGGGWWVLSADVFGSTLCRAGEPDVVAILKPAKATSKAASVLQSTREIIAGAFGQTLVASATSINADIVLHSEDTITSGAQKVTIPKPDCIKSYATDGNTMVLATALSHRLLVIGRSSSP